MGELIFEIFGKWLILGIYGLFSSLYDWVKGKLIGVPKTEIERKRLEKKWLYKKVTLTEKAKNGIDIGTNGTVMELIDKKTVFAEFYDNKGDFIEIENKVMLEIKLNILKIKK